MELRFINGSTVSRIYGDHVAELLAGFQFSSDAIAFAETKLAEDADRKYFDSYYVVVNHCDGELRIVRHQKQAA